MTIEQFLEQEPRKLHFYGPELAWMRTAKEIIKKQAEGIEFYAKASIVKYDSGTTFDGVKIFWDDDGGRAQKCQHEVEEILK